MLRFLYCTFPRWPEDGDRWVHPDDVAVARRLIPSNRVFRRRIAEDGYIGLEYGPYRLRVLPRMCVPIDVGPLLSIGDWVEIRSDRGRLSPALARVREVRWNAALRRVEYFLSQRGLLLPRPFSLRDLSLRPVPLVVSSS